MEEGKQAQLSGIFVLLLIWHIWSKAFTILDILWRESYTIVLDITAEQAEQLKLRKALKISTVCIISMSFIYKLDYIPLIYFFFFFFFHFLNSGMIH